MVVTSFFLAPSILLKVSWPLVLLLHGFKMKRLIQLNFFSTAIGVILIRFFLYLKAGRVDAVPPVEVNYIFGLRLGR